MLHDFEGHSVEEIAQRLGCARGTVLSRLARGANRLKQRLDPKNLAPVVSFGVCGHEFVMSKPPIPQAFIESTVGIAAKLMFTKDGPGPVPAPINMLARGVSRAVMVAGACRIVLSSALALLLVGFSVGLIATMAREQDSRRAPAAETGISESAPTHSTKAHDPQRATPSQVVEIRGRVVDHEGQPVPAARILLDPKFQSITGEEFGIPTERAVSGSDGRFSFFVRRSELEALRKASGPQSTPVFAAVASGGGTAWVDLPAADGPVHDLELKLTADDVPIIGRLIDTEGRPLAGVRASVFSIMELPNQDARGFLRRMRSQDREIKARSWQDLRYGLVLGFYDRAPSALSDSNGVFHLTSVGRDRIVLLDLRGDTVAESIVMVITTGEPVEEPIVVNPGDSNEMRLHGPRFGLVMSPGRELSGTIRDQQTGEALAGIRLISTHDSDEAASLAISDAQGRYRLTSLPFSTSRRITIDPQRLPFFSSNLNVAIPPGTGPVLLDLALARGVLVEGRITHRDTGRPVRARIGYFPLINNQVFEKESVKDSNYKFTSMTGTDLDGHYRLVALPGPGLLAVTSQEHGLLTFPPPDEELISQVADKEGLDRDFGSYGKQYRRIDIPGTVKTITAYTRSKTLQALTQDFALEPGRPVKIRVEGPDGKPVPSARPVRTEGVSRLEGPGEAPGFVCP